MNRLLRIAAVLAGSSALPAFAHLGATATPHWHAGDGAGVLAVVAILAVAVWLDRRWR